jgi:signal transduction histidine kinase
VNVPKIPTEFAPAERAAIGEIQEQARLFLGFSLLCKILDAVPDIIMILNENRQVVFANKALLDLLGVQRLDFTGGLRPGEVLNCAHAFQSIGGCGTTEFCRTCGAVQAIICSLRGEETVNECRITREDGAALDLRVWGTPLTVDDQQFSVLALQDITHEKRRQVLERIFFHDILNTAGTVRGFAEILPDTKPEYQEEISGHIYRLSNLLIDEIKAQKELVTAEDGELVVHPDSLDAVAVLQEVATGYSSHEAARDRHIEIDPCAQPVAFASDPVLLKRVLGNMLKNALEAARPGETVTLSCEVVEGRVEFSVHNPNFMPRDVQLQIFQRSFTTKGTGRGLGTYGMKLLSERYLKGTVAFTSSPEQGTTFTACYPLKLVEDETA